MKKPLETTLPDGLQRSKLTDTDPSPLTRTTMRFMKASIIDVAKLTGESFRG